MRHVHSNGFKVGLNDETRRAYIHIHLEDSPIQFARVEFNLAEMRKLRQILSTVERELVQLLREEIDE